MRLFRGMWIWFAIVAASTVVFAQSRSGSGAGGERTDTRYFQLTLDLKFPTSAEGQPQPADESITTQVAIRDGKPGYYRTRMTSQFPLVIAGKTTFRELGTKFDCNDIHLDGNGVALSIVLETSSLRGTVKTKNLDGSETEEPIISQRNLSLGVKLPLDKPKVIFDSKTADLSKLQKTGLNGTPLASAAVPQQPGLQLTMTATELK